MLENLTNRRGERLDFALEGAGAPKDGIVLIGHGVTANKDRDWAVSLARGLNDAGSSTLRFSFSGNGQSAGRFEESTISKEVEDLVDVIDAVAAQGVEKVTYVGHSMGGAVGVRCAHNESRITRLVSLAGMVHTHRFAQRKFGDLRPGTDVMWDKPECPLSQTFLDDMQAIDSVVALGSEISVPWLLVHGDADTVVPLEDSQDIHARNDASVLTVIPGADHLFSGETEPVMVQTVVDWLKANA